MWLREMADRAAATVRSKRVAILCLWRAAADEDLCYPPRRRVRSARVPQVPVDCWTVGEVQGHPGGLPWPEASHPCGLRRSAWWELAVMVAWDTALRRGDQFGEPGWMRSGPTAALWSSSTDSSRAQPIRLSEETLAVLRRSVLEGAAGVGHPVGASEQTFAKQFSRLVELPGCSEYGSGCAGLDHGARHNGPGRGPQGGHAQLPHHGLELCQPADRPGPEVHPPATL
jgi:hypothetical protein